MDSLREACSQVKAWEAIQPTLSLSVNVSARQLQEPRIVEDVAQALGDSGLAAGSLTLEITESVLMEDAEITMTRLQQLKRLGVLLAIDDFGTGYSSLGYLRRFPIDLIKVDRSFVSELGGGRGEDALVRAIVRLGHSLNIRTLAEGIETPQQVRELQALGCPPGQGYLFSRPADADSIAALLASPVAIEQTVASSSSGVGAPKRNEVRLATEFAPDRS